MKNIYNRVVNNQYALSVSELQDKVGVTTKYYNDSAFIDNVFNNYSLNRSISYYRITFKNCHFSNCYIRLPYTLFVNCTFNGCTFERIIDCTFKECKGSENTIQKYSNYYCDISGTVTFENCALSIILSRKIKIDSATKFKVVNSPQLSYLLLEYINTLNNNKKEEEKQKELRKDLKYGYKIVYAPVLVKLSFPESAKVVNLDIDSSKADCAYVESIQLIGENTLNLDSVTNFKFQPLTYKVGENVYSNGFDYDIYGPGIHFVTDIENLPSATDLSDNEFNIIKKLTL